MRQADRLTVIRWQFDMTWMLASRAHLPHLTDEACLWKPAAGSWTVAPDDEGQWRPDWSDEEPGPAPPVTIGWLSWHLIWWWSELLDRLQGSEPAARETVLWPGSADAVRARLNDLHQAWTQFTGGLDDAALDRPFAHPWPEKRPLIYALTWANTELMKNVAEIGLVRHQYEAAHRTH